MTLKINLALQGGGAHGAFTWGVLDRFLDETDVEIASISGTSAGALNGAAFKAGLIAGGREGARENLDWLWGQVAGTQGDTMSSWMMPFTPGTVSKAIENSLPFVMMDAASRMFSPYSYGPFYTNPLTDIVERFKWDKVCANEGPQLFVCATNVRSGKIRVFTGDEINTDVILASACLPTMFKAVELVDPKTGKTEAFWDGGYTGNPALFPMFASDLPDDIVVVNINPLERDDVPTTPQDIQNRINEISFNTSLLRELRAIEFAKRLMSQGALTSGTMKDVKVHMIADDGLMNELSVATKTVPSPYIIATLKGAGQAAAEQFLNAHKAKIGLESSVDLGAMFG